MAAKISTPPLSAILLLLISCLLLHGDDRPNVLIFMVDDLGSADLSSYGSDDILTPNIDTLAGEGLRFNQFYTNSCVCSPTRAALLTGCFPELVGMPGVTRHNADDSWGYLSPDSVSLPTLFQEADYRTTLIGKWHLGEQKENRPNQRGFDEFHGFILGMMDDYWVHTRQGVEQMRHNEEVIYPQGHATDLITQWGIDALKRDAASNNPFFLLIAYNAPHFPVQPPAVWLERVKRRNPGLSEKRMLMAAFVEHMDAGIGKVLRTLDTLELRENTIVFFCSDNGGLLSVGSSNGPLRAGKTHLYEGGIKTPAMIRWPAQIDAGRSTDFVAMTMDILPTIAELCGISIDHEIDGASFAPLLLADQQDAFERPVFHRRISKGKSQEYVRLGDWKLVSDPLRPLGEPETIHYELYNLSEDPYETNDLSEMQPEKVKKMASLLQDHVDRAEAVPWKRPNE